MTSNAAADHYRALVQARSEQQVRLGAPIDRSYWDQFAHTYRFDPTRAPEPQLAAALEYVQSDDEIVEIGGGAGRIGLPLVVHARSLRNVEPSAAMREHFALSALEHGIDHAMAIAAAWPLDEPINADIALTVDVTYFIEEIEPFLRAMHETARRRVLILTWTVPPPDVNGELFEVAFGETQAPSPSYRDLLPVIWGMGSVPDVRVLPQPFEWPEQLPMNDDEAVAFAIAELGVQRDDRVARRIRDAMTQLFEPGEPYRPLWRTPSRAMLLTWETRD